MSKLNTFGIDFAGKPVKMEIVDNFGDPGIDSPVADAADKSKYLICKIVEPYIVGQADGDFTALFHLVKTPSHLHINITAGGERQDAFGNTETNIGRISPIYEEGEHIFAQYTSAAEMVQANLGFSENVQWTTPREGIAITFDRVSFEDLNTAGRDRGSSCVPAIVVSPNIFPSAVADQYTYAPFMRGSTGYTGSGGDTGPAGDAANTGATGYSGPTGYTGDSGDLTGPTGDTGNIGATGYSGSTGYTGDTGYTGNIGATGYSGSTGYTGDTGDTGDTGSKGDTGEQGLVGDSANAMPYEAINGQGSGFGVWNLHTDPGKGKFAFVVPPDGNVESVMAILVNDENSEGENVKGWNESFKGGGNMKIVNANDPSIWSIFKTIEADCDEAFCIGHRCYWPGLAAITTDSKYKTLASLDVTYSFIQAGTAADGGRTCVTLEDSGSGANHEEFIADIESAFNEWKIVFEFLYPWLTLNFINLGEEVGTNVPSNSYQPLYGLPNSANNIGDFRIGMHHFENEGLAHAYLPVEGRIGALGDVCGDIHFDSNFRWRADASVPRPFLGPNSDGWYGDFSVKMTMVHEIGHALGLGHNSQDGTIMYPSQSTYEWFDGRKGLEDKWMWGGLFPNGLLYAGDPLTVDSNGSPIGPESIPAITAYGQLDVACLQRIYGPGSDVDTGWYHESQGVIDRSDDTTSERPSSEKKGILKCHRHNEL